MSKPPRKPDSRQKLELTWTCPDLRLNSSAIGIGEENRNGFFKSPDAVEVSRDTLLTDVQQQLPPQYEGLTGIRHPLNLRIPKTFAILDDSDNLST
jgi:hypothetical protein